MPVFSMRSLQRLSTCHPKLQEVMLEAIKETDFTVLCGHRGESDQLKAFESGNSTVKWPNSKHNPMPSLAVDVAPYPIDWKDIDRFKALAVIVKRIAVEKGIKIVWGGDWVKFKDYPHYEIKEG